MRKINHLILTLGVLSFLISICSFNNIQAEDNKTTIDGSFYVFDSDSQYVFNNALAVQDTNSNALGNMMIGGEILDVTEKNGVPAFKMGGTQASTMCMVMSF